MKIEILPHDTEAQFGPEAFERINPELAQPLAPEPAPLADPPSHYRKAIDWQLDSPDLPWQIVRCRECNGDMYSRNPEKRDVCEECMWLMADKLQDLAKHQVKQLENRVVNPFRSGGDIFRELSGSLPSVKAPK